MKTLVVSFLLISSAFAETNLERGKRVVDEALAALGGDKFLSMQNRVESGRAYSFYRERLSGLSIATISTRYLPKDQAAPGKLLSVERQGFGKEEKFGAVLFTRDAGYEITFRGARPMPKDTVDRYQISMMHNVFYILRERLSEPGLIFESQGSEVFENQPVEIVNIVDSENRTVTVYFNRTSKLPIRQIFFRRDPNTRERIEEVTVYSKYRDVSGVQLPYSVQRTRDGAKIYEMYSDTVAINQDLPDSMFQLPQGIKMLKPAD